MGAGQWRSSAPSTVGEFGNEQTSGLKFGFFYFIFCRVKLDVWRVCACVNKQKSVSHGETVRVGSSN